MPTLQIILLASAATTTALMAGLFYAYSCSVNPGLSRLADAPYLAAMQSIKRAILNPLFFIGFMGTALLLPLNTWINYGQPIYIRYWLLLSASLVYLIGVIAVTMLGNVPLNEELDLFNVNTASPAELAVHRSTFELPSNQFNTIRTVFSLLAVLLVIAACLSPKAD
jgi:uncharacterized membrane protein